MAERSGKSMFAQSMGSSLNQSIASHANDETNFGNIQVPPGIKNGRAQLVELYFDQYKNGVYKDKYFCRFVGSILSPESVTNHHGTQKCRGLQTSLMIPVCDTKTQAGKVTTKDEYIARILNEMRKLGADTSTCESGQDLENLALMLEQTKPIFKFETSLKQGQTVGNKTYPDGVWENWYGVQPDDDLSGLDIAAQETQDATSEPDDQVNEWVDSTDIDSMLAVTMVDDPDVNACDRLKELARAAGMSDEQVDADDTTWEDLGNFVKQAMEPQQVDTGEWKPVKGVEARIMVYDKLKKTVTKSVDVVIASDPDKDSKVLLTDRSTGKALVDPRTAKLMGLVGISNLSPPAF